jgi:hypothetical protein
MLGGLAGLLPVACGLAFDRSAARRVSRPWSGLKDARRITRIRSARHGSSISFEAMSVIIGIDPHERLHAACAIDETEREVDDDRGGEDETLRSVRVPGRGVSC